MPNLNILIVEGNDPKNNEFFVKAAKASCSQNLKNLVLKLEPNSKIEIINPERDDENWMKHTVMWLDEKNRSQLGYRDVNMNTLTNEVQPVPPVARVY